MATVKKRRGRRKSRKAKSGLYTSSKSTKVFKYRSGWEKSYMEYLDENPDIIAWDYECFKIPYISGKYTKKVRMYFPDFYIDHAREGKSVIEIKPKKKLKNTLVVLKTAAAELWCKKLGYRFTILTEIELKAMNIL